MNTTGASNFVNFLTMGGYGWYIWGAYGMTLVAIAVEIVAAKLRRRNAFRMIRRIRNVSLLSETTNQRSPS